MSTRSPSTPTLILATLSGPEPVNATLTQAGEIGRSVECAVALPAGAGVSRRHARLTTHAGAWYVEDLASRSGTFLNGVRLSPASSGGGKTPLRSGDLLHIGGSDGWEFLITLPGAAGSGMAGSRTPGSRGTGRTLATLDDRRTSASRVELLDSVAFQAGSAQRLALLTGLVERLAGGGGEEAFGLEALRAALDGGGGERGALLRPVDAAGMGSLEVIASIGIAAGGPSPTGVSRTLIAEAMAGRTARLSGGAETVSGASIAELGIKWGVAAPVRIGERVVACLYVDAQSQRAASDEAAGFIEAVARVLGLALAEVHRKDLEQRQFVVNAELEAAHKVQQLLLPAGGRGMIEAGGYQVALAVLPGRFVAGDMVEIVRMPGGRVAVAIGDATGHGVGPAMLIATVQSRLAALLETGVDPAEVVSRVNRRVCERVEGGLFVTLWLGVFGPGGEVEVIDGGHGHTLQSEGGGWRAVKSAGGIPLGIDPEFDYKASRLNLAAGERVVIYSDGVVEERGPDGVPFGVEGLTRALGGSDLNAEATVGRVVESVKGIAVSGLTDDATVAVIERLM